MRSKIVTVLGYWLLCSLCHYSQAALNLSEFRGILTFDDGPHPYTTPQVIQTLKSANIPTSQVFFFFCGEHVRDYPSLVKMVIDAGFTIGYHSMHHDSQVGLTVQQIERDIQQFKQTVDGVLGYHYPVQIGRPPYGGMTSRTLPIFTRLESRGQLAKMPVEALNELLVEPNIRTAFTNQGLVMQLWNIDFDDWKQPIDITHAQKTYLPKQEQVWLFHEMPLYTKNPKKRYDNNLPDGLSRFLQEINRLEKQTVIQDSTQNYVPKNHHIANDATRRTH